MRTNHPVQAPSPTTTHSAPKVFVKPTLDDILCGRGPLINNNPGNIMYRRLVAANKVLYRTCPMEHKHLLVQSIVDALSPRRFLKEIEPQKKKSTKQATNMDHGMIQNMTEYDHNSSHNNQRSDGFWYVIAREEALRKTAQSLRECDSRTTMVTAMAVYQDGVISVLEQFGHDMPGFLIECGNPNDDDKKQLDNGTKNSIRPTKKTRKYPPVRPQPHAAFGSDNDECQTPGSHSDSIQPPTPFEVYSSSSVVASSSNQLHPSSASTSSEWEHQTNTTRVAFPPQRPQVLVPEPCIEHGAKLLATLRPMATTDDGPMHPFTRA